MEGLECETIPGRRIWVVIIVDSFGGREKRVESVISGMLVFFFMDISFPRGKSQVGRYECLLLLLPPVLWKPSR